MIQKYTVIVFSKHAFGTGTARHACHLTHGRGVLTCWFTGGGWAARREHGALGARCGWK